ncbi:hypothetical protein PVAP13_8NG061902 [Panicum virgatum]|uniref:Uncharacterized protein n=1 Tax=Panicum virgatum TaxID=38727 RepID=A0A8T0P5S1_PANVG|nr:hypothetical protein PVAP13_8NG061902 [Panicum virgatum]
MPTSLRSTRSLRAVSSLRPCRWRRPAKHSWRSAVALRSPFSSADCFTCLRTLVKQAVRCCNWYEAAASVFEATRTASLAARGVSVLAPPWPRRPPPWSGRATLSRAPQLRPAALAPSLGLPLPRRIQWQRPLRGASPPRWTPRAAPPLRGAPPSPAVSRGGLAWRRRSGGPARTSSSWQPWAARLSPAPSDPSSSAESHGDLARQRRIQSGGLPPRRRRSGSRGGAGACTRLLFLAAMGGAALPCSLGSPLPRSGSRGGSGAGLAVEWGSRTRLLILAAMGGAALPCSLGSLLPGVLPRRCGRHCAGIVWARGSSGTPSK